MNKYVQALRGTAIPTNMYPTTPTRGVRAQVPTSMYPTDPTRGVRATIPKNMYAV